MYLYTCTQHTTNLKKSRASKKTRSCVFKKYLSETTLRVKVKAQHEQNQTAQFAITRCPRIGSIHKIQ